ncbi:hypothetical protein LARV_00751 [Longilinea arvoryzae]|uniref:Golgi phosphoprotein 3 n=1 Tax=Longilinea arvoryzae TaxID=360412 RepID=A0A0S7BG51_9CHLR|nr:hypothetical protein [Longilinea arvoryzae]GAP13010.1 hypothetical protein LARV_00751 [Longilinea arvoryzae]
MAQLTPSELVYLNGEQFAGEPRASRRTRLLHSGREVHLAQLVQAALASALLANLQTGTLLLSQREHSRWFGLVKKEILSVEPTGKSADWPAQTLEADVLAAAGSSDVHKESGDLARLIYVWLKTSYDDPFAEVVTRIQNGLAARGLLNVIEERKLLSVKRSYAVPPETLALAQDIKSIQNMLEQFQVARPQLWPLLLETIKKAVMLRQGLRETDLMDVEKGPPGEA